MTTEVMERAGAPAQRGRTVVEDTVCRRLVERTVLSVPGVTAHRTLVPGRTLPAVAVGGPPDARRIEVDIAVTWPTEGATLIGSVCSAVERELTTSLGAPPEHVEVRIARVDTVRSPAQVADGYADVPQGEREALPHNARRFAPRAMAAATVSAVVIAIALLALGVIALRDVVAGGSDWISAVCGWVAGQHWQWWWWPAAVLAALAGLVLFVVALTPRRRTHVLVGDGVWVPRSMAQTYEGALP
ncbi:hypothetical protein [Mycolicibacterium cosmeticum]|uniref:hypothetical protein n=1 Tax=Mycolicibacterium cosmeticum TaxID=258533 RepID=UPI003204B85C